MKIKFTRLQITASALTLALSVSFAWAGEPAVSNVRATQRAQTQVVDVFYDLSATNNCPFSVFVEVSTNNGTSYDLPVASFSGSGFGNAVTPGTRKQVIWNAGDDWPGHYSSAVRFKVTASESSVPANMVFVQGGTLPDIGNGVLNVESFLIGKYEVTWGEWKAVRVEAEVRGYDIGGVGDGCADNHPVHRVFWYDVVKWCNLRSEIEGRTPAYRIDGNVYKSGSDDDVMVDATANGYRLPTEAQWEFAARGGTQSQGYEYSGGNDVNAVAWFWDNSGGAACDYSVTGHGTWPVGGKAANELGIYDMSGNVWEWCFDWWRPEDESADHVWRGGGWSFGERYCRSANRDVSPPGLTINFRGFRVVAPPPGQ